MACCIVCQRPTGETPAPQIADGASRGCEFCQETLLRLLRELLQPPDPVEGRPI